jgi:preprotein translocase subunit SecA
LPEQYQKLLQVVDEDELIRAEKIIGLYVLNKCWADYLLFVENITEGIHLISLGKGDPVMNFNMTIIEGFNNFQQQVEDEMLDALENMVIKDGHIDLDVMGIKGPSSTRTYMVTDGSDEVGMIEAVGQLAAKMFTAPFYLIAMLIEKVFRKKG